VAAPAIEQGTKFTVLPSNVRSGKTLTTFCRHLKSHLFQPAFATAQRLTSSPLIPISTMELYKSIYLLT